MVNRFSGIEIVEIGIQIEINGRDFYNGLAERSKNEAAKNIFKYLAGEEEKHIKDFSHILNSVEQHVPKEAYPDEYFAYMNKLAENYVFTKKNKGKVMARQAKTDTEGINLGIDFERSSITFYEGMKKIIPSKDIRLLDRLIQEEEKHLIKLTELKHKA